MDVSRIVAGRRIVGMLRSTECGHWYLTTDGDRFGGALLIDPALTRPTRDGAGSTRRPTGAGALVEEVRAIRSAALPGVQPVADLVIVRDSGPESGQVWLLTYSPPGPTVRDLLELGPADGLNVGSAATLLNETAQTLLGLHRAGIVHGGFGPSTVFVAGDGKAALGEVGLAGALGLRPASPADDVQAWARLAALLAREWGEDVEGTDMLTGAAVTAARADLIQARDELLAGRDLLPPDFLKRRALIAAVESWTDTLHTYTERGGEAAAEDARIDLAHGVVSLLGPAAIERDDLDRRTRAPLVRTPIPARVEIRGDPRHAPEHGSLRQPQRALVGPQGPDQPQHPPRGGGAPRSSRRRRLLFLVGAVGLAGLLAAGFQLWRSHGEQLTVERVSIQAPSDDLSCGSTAEIVGIIETDGHAGDVQYRWVRDDGMQTEADGGGPNDQDIASVHVPDGQTRTEIYLRWTFEGEGTVEASVHLVVLAPAPASANESLSYVCE